MYKEIKDKVKEKILDYLQKLRVNGELYWIIDNLVDICFIVTY